jgi:hypothetical protein
MMKALAVSLLILFPSGEHAAAFITPFSNVPSLASGILHMKLKDMVGHLRYKVISTQLLFSHFSK